LRMPSNRDTKFIEFVLSTISRRRPPHLCVGRKAPDG
jgi:hypothetical protein